MVKLYGPLVCANWLDSGKLFNYIYVGCDDVIIKEMDSVCLKTILV